MIRLGEMSLHTQRPVVRQEVTQTEKAPARTLLRVRVRRGDAIMIITTGLGGWVDGWVGVWAFSLPAGYRAGLGLQLDIHTGHRMGAVIPLLDASIAIQ